MPTPSRALRSWLGRGFRRVFPHPAPPFAALWRSACTKWMLTEAVREPGLLHGYGWAVVPPERRADFELHINGVPATRLTFPTRRPDVAKQLPFVPDALESGFEFVHHTADAGADLAFTAHDGSTGEAFGPDYPPAYVPGVLRAGPLPGGPRIARVIGDASGFSFRTGGDTAARTLSAAVASVDPRGLAAFPRVLDWGCGAARVSRYWLGEPGVVVTGADVDPDNVGWCREALPRGHWHTLPLRPPAPFPDASFDLAVGVSVLTHLGESTQREWLGELRRLVRPGGLALLTFHGEASWVWSGLSAERYAVLKREGFADQPNPLYDADLGEPGYYRDAFHTPEYVRRVWGEFFEVLRLDPCAVAHQDLAVLRRR